MIASIAAVICMALLVTSQGHAEPSTAAKLTPPVITEPFTLLPCPAHASSTIAMEGCQEHKIIRGDAAIDAAMRKIFPLLPDDAARRRFVTAARAWLAYRRADCSSVSDLYEGGTFASVEFGICTVARNARRLEDLQSFAHDLRHP